MSVQDYSIECEMNVLGSIMLTDRVMPDVLSVITEADFYRPAHRLIFGAMQTLFKAGAPIEQISVEDQLTLQGNLEDIGGPKYLLELAMSTAGAANAGYYAGKIKFYSGLRDDKRDAHELFRLADEGVPESERDALKVGMRTRSADPKQRAVIRHISECESEDGKCGGFVKSTWPYLDALTYQGGLPRGQVTTAKGKSGKGKSTWAISTALRMTQKEGYSLIYASFADLNAEHLNFRARRALTGFSEPETLEQLDAAEKARKALRRINLEIYDAAEITDGDNEIETFGAWLKATIKKKTVDAVILDYAQEIQTSRQFRTTFEAQSHIARYTRILAQQTNVAMIVLSQVNADEQTSDSRNWHKISALELMVLEDAIRVDKNRFSGKTGINCPHRFDEQRQIYVDR